MQKKREAALNRNHLTEDRLSLNAAELPKLDAEFEGITKGEELTKKEKLKAKRAAMEAVTGDPKRIALVAADLLAHFEKRLKAT